MLVLVALLARAISAEAEPVTSKTGVPGLPANWEVQIDPDDMDSFMAPSLETETGMMPQQTQNRYLGMLTTIWDAKLLTTYLKLLGRLDDAGKVKLGREQTAWLKKREHVAHEAEMAEEGGTLAPASYSRAFIDLTRQREAELAKRLPHAGGAGG